MAAASEGAGGGRRQEEHLTQQEEHCQSGGRQRVPGLKPAGRRRRYGGKHGPKARPDEKPDVHEDVEAPALGTQPDTRKLGKLEPQEGVTLELASISGELLATAVVERESTASEVTKALLSAARERHFSSDDLVDGLHRMQGDWVFPGGYYQITSCDGYLKFAQGDATGALTKWPQAQGDGYEGELYEANALCGTMRLRWDCQSKRIISNWKPAGDTRFTNDVFARIVVDPWCEANCELLLGTEKLTDPMAQPLRECDVGSTAMLTLVRTRFRFAWCSDGCTVEGNRVTGDPRRGLAFGSRGFTSGVHRWRLRKLAGHPSSSASFGVCSPLGLSRCKGSSPLSDHSELLACVPDAVVIYAHRSQTTASRCRAGCGLTRHAAAPHERAKSLGAGSEFEVLLDCDAGAVTIYHATDGGQHLLVPTVLAEVRQLSMDTPLCLFLCVCAAESWEVVA